MLSRRLLSFALVGLCFLIFSISVRTNVEAETMLQDVPRLDGLNLYFSESAGEASRFDRTDSGLSHFAGLLSELGANLYSLEWRTGIPDNIDLIVIAGPLNDMPPDQIARLWLYLSGGGRLLLLSNTAYETRGTLGALPGRGGLYNLMWADLGMRARDDVVVTSDVAAAGIDPATQTQPGALIPNFVTSQRNPSDPITQNLNGTLAFFSARSLEVDASIQGFHAVPLVFTTDQFYGEAAYAQYLKDGTLEFNIGVDTTSGELPLAAASTNNQTGARVVVIGDREFITNGGGLKTSPANSSSFVYPDNVRFMLNATTWLLERDAVTMNFPTPAPTATVTITPSPTPIPSPTPAAG